jgi:hypothetical protein
MLIAERKYMNTKTEAPPESTDVVLDETSQRFVDQLIDKLMLICDELSGHALRPYQTPLARRIFESIIIGDGNTITALMARQVGKTETIANVIATCMLMLPRLSRVFSSLHKFREGVMVGAFAPVEEQADTLFGRIVGCLSSDRAAAMMMDPEIDERLTGRGKEVRLKRCGSLVRRTTCHPRASIEGRTYHVILVDESQFADDRVINKSVAPMGAANRATMVFTGTPTVRKNVFYKNIQINKRAKGKRNHFQVDWKEAGRYNENYRKFVQDEMRRLGEDSNEFKLSYRCMWLLDQGMFTSSAKLDALGDTSMQKCVEAYNLTPVVVGIDCGRKQDRTIVTVVYVDWDNPDPFGMYHHRILNWLDLEGVDWEEQYFRIREFLANYNVWKIAIDAGGLGDVVADRLTRLIPYSEIVTMQSSPAEQSRRWKHLMQLIDREQISWPAGAKVQTLKRWKRFRQEMEELELEYKGPLMMAQAPKEVNAHDDYPDSLALACVLSLDEGTSEVEVYDNFFFR